MTHSLLATSVASDFVNSEMHRHTATYRHGAQVKDVPVMFWSVLRCEVARKVVYRVEGGCCECLTRHRRAF